MTGVHPAIGELLNASPTKRTRILTSCAFLTFNKITSKILSIIMQLPLTFTFSDLYNSMDKNNRNKLISLCMAASTKAIAKGMILEARKSKNNKYFLQTLKRYS